jgi:tRNA threonylcarbamoyladenosine biosynthesis protein TsaB
MRILALETSSTAGSVAALEDERLLGQTPFSRGQRTAQSFAPSILRQLADAGWQPEDVQLVAVAHGPGSFTGLRIGVTAAKTMAYALGAEVIGVNTLKVIAHQVPERCERVGVVLDAQRKQLFAATFQRAPGQRDGWLEGEPTAVVDASLWLERLAPGATVTGPGLARIRDRIPPEVSVVDSALWAPQAGSVGLVAYLEYRAGRREDLWRLVPHYYRKSAAEEKYEGEARSRRS